MICLDGEDMKENIVINIILKVGSNDKNATAIPDLTPLRVYFKSLNIACTTWMVVLLLLGQSRALRSQAKAVWKKSLAVSFVG